MFLLLILLARVDIAGTWSDTPPVCYDNGGCVAMLAIVIDQKVFSLKKLLITNTSLLTLYLYITYATIHQNMTDFHYT